MTKRFALFLIFALMIVLFTAAAAQDTTVVKGVCKDDNGKAIAGGTVELANLDNGHKLTVNTNHKGEYSTSGAGGGTYKISLFGPGGKLLSFLNNVAVKPGVENVYDFDMAKLRVEAAKSAPSDAQRKANEQAKANNQKLEAINALLTKAAEQKKDKQYDQAVATMEQAAAQDQTHDVIYASLGDAYLLDKKFPEAETAYNKAIALAPLTSKALGSYHADLALALVQQGKTGPSLAECDKAAQLDPASAALCYYNEGAILTNQGKADEATQAFDKSIAADPSRPDPYYQKGVNLLAKATLGKDGKMTPAPGTAAAFRKYLELAPEGKYAQTAKDLLTSIGAPIQTTYGTKKDSKK